MDELYQKIKDLRQEVNRLRKRESELMTQLIGERAKREELEARLSAKTGSAKLPPEFDKFFGGIFKGDK